MIEVTLNCEEVVGDSFVKIGCVAGAIARAMDTSNLGQAERKLFRRVNSGVQLGLLNPLDPETLEPLSREDYGMGVVSFHELVEWGHATNLFKFKSEFISPAAVPWARAAPSMRDMVAAVHAKAAPVIRQEPEAAAVVTPEPSAAPTLAANVSGGVELDKVRPDDEKPWMAVDPSDPKAEQPWYTPARYFARQLVIKDSTLLVKKLVLAEKVAMSLKGVGIYKRGGKKQFDAATVLKAFANVTLG